jgi:hypothetical protein
MTSIRILYLGLILAVSTVAVGTASAIVSVRAPVYVDAFAHGRITRAVEGVRFSLRVPRSGWENGPHVRVNRKWRTLGLYVSHNIVGPQDADVVLLWTAFPKGGLATPCGHLLKPAGRSAADLAEAMSRARGIKVVVRPERVTVGGRRAWHALLKVLNEDRGCDPGFFFTWGTGIGGAFWNETHAGYAIEVWIVDVAGKRLVFEGESKWGGGDETVMNMVDSIRFE